MERKYISENTSSQSKNLVIPFDFYVDNLEIRKDEVFGLGELEKLLQTAPFNINTQDNLNLFLSDPNRFKTIRW